MSEEEQPPQIDEELWVESAENVAEKLREYAKEFGSFTPERFAQMKFHLLRGPGLIIQSRDELCTLSIHSKTCPKCDLLYVAKKCLLWYRLFKIIQWKTVERAPPCIRLAFAKNRIKTVANYLFRANLINPPFYKTRGWTSCKVMRRWGWCQPNQYCRAMTSDNIMEYNTAREHVRSSQHLR